MEEFKREKLDWRGLLIMKLSSRKFLLTASASLIDIVLMAMGKVDATIGVPALMALIGLFNVGQGIADKQ